MRIKRPDRIDAKKKRKPQDATLRNIRALRKRVEKLEKLVQAVMRNVYM